MYSLSHTYPQYVHITLTAKSRPLWGPQYVHIIRTGRRRAVGGNGGAVAGNGGAVAGNGRAVAGRADSAHQHRLIQQEAVAIFGRVVLWCSCAFWFLGLQSAAVTQPQGGEAYPSSGVV